MIFQALVTISWLRVGDVEVMMDVAVKVMVAVVDIGMIMVVVIMLVPL
jgi:hypothetical protein